MKKKEQRLLENRRLTCWVEDHQLVIRIGIGTIAWASRKRNGGPLSGKFSVTDKQEFSSDVARSICREDEIGNSKLQELLDWAMQDAADRGCTGLKYPT